MLESTIISFRVRQDCVDWITSQRLPRESLNKAAQRLLAEYAEIKGAELSPSPSKSSVDSDAVNLSTDIVDIVDKAMILSLDPVMERLATFEERLGKLSAWAPNNSQQLRRN